MGKLASAAAAPPAGTPELLSGAQLPIRRQVSKAKWVTSAVAVYVALVLIQFFVFNENWHWEVVLSYMFSERILTGLLNTIVLTILTTLLGLCLGILTAACRMSPLPILRAFAALYVWVIRATPPLVMLLFVFFLGALVPRLEFGIPFGPSFFGIPTNDVISRFSAAIVGLGIYLGGYSAEVFRGGITAIPSGQFEACKALGMSPWAAYTKVLGPQAIRVIIPPMANEVITMFKATSLVTVIGYSELLTTVQLIYARNFQTIPLLTVAVIWYLVLTSIAMFGQSKLEKRFGRGFNRRVMKSPDSELQTGLQQVGEPR